MKLWIGDFIFSPQKMNCKKILAIFLLSSLVFSNDNLKENGTLITYISGSPENYLSRKIDKIDNFSNSIHIKDFNNHYFSSFYIYNSKVYVDELYYKKKFPKNRFGNFNLKIGSLTNNFSNIDNKILSSGSMIESGNSYGIPRYLVEFSSSFKNIDIYLSLSDGILDKNSVNIKRPFIHDKRLYLGFKNLSIGFVHNVIWGGEVTGYGKQPNDLDDYFRVFLGRGGGADAVITDQPNALGDAFGMWDFSYKKNIGLAKMKVYHQTYFEDGSGLQLTNKMSQFDGLSGISFNYKKTNILIEKLKTTFQGGNTHPPGIDSYYWNGIYRNGWQFKDRIIGNIFINPSQNRVRVIHFGLSTIYKKNKFQLNFSDIKKYNISYNGFPPSETIDLGEDTFKKEIQRNLYYERKLNKFHVGIMLEDNQINTNTYFKIKYQLQ